MDFLSEIIAVKRQRIAAAKSACPLDRMRELARQVRIAASPHLFAEAIRGNSRINIIAEFKRRSPSKGRINSHADPATMATVYEAAGAAAVSVLTEEDYFEGSLEDLRRIREAIRLPILRKDFIVDEYQVYETAFARADALLLIVAALDDQTVAKLRAIAEDELGIDALVEVHTEAELDRAVNCGARLIGVNNRDLRTFDVSVATSTLLAQLAPRDVILVSESGLTPKDVRRLKTIGYSAFLVGETLMRADDAGDALREFIQVPEGSRLPRRVWVKICGITSSQDAHAAIDAGADMLGLNFYRRSPRFVEPKAAAEIASTIRSRTETTRGQVSLIGVFVNEAINKVLQIADEVGLHGIQLHGDETLEYCRQLKESSSQRFVIKTFASAEGVNWEMLRNYPVDAIMIDAFDANQRGGTGRVADWRMAREASEKLPRLFLAGGLSPENVSDAIAKVGPYAVDACSSLEYEPGRKSAKRMKQFVDVVRLSKLHDEAMKT